MDLFQVPIQTLPLIKQEENTACSHLRACALVVTVAGIGAS